MVIITCTKQGNSPIKLAVYNQERFIIKSGFKSRAGYNGTCTVLGLSLELPLYVVANEARSELNMD